MENYIPGRVSSRTRVFTPAQRLPRVQSTFAASPVDPKPGKLSESDDSKLVNYLLVKREKIAESRRIAEEKHRKTITICEVEAVVEKKKNPSNQGKSKFNIRKQIKEKKGHLKVKYKEPIGSVPLRKNREAVKEKLAEIARRDNEKKKALMLQNVTIQSGV